MGVECKHPHAYSLETGGNKFVWSYDLPVTI